jgi:putative SOS response-associated peptidase YedK
MLRDQSEEEAWLAHATPPGALAELLVPLPEALTARRAVGPAVSDARYDGPDCLADAEPEPDGAPTLF